jgi:hypothetical protein
MIAAVVIIVAALTAGHDGSPEPLPSESCMAIATAAVKYLQPAADAVAGRSVPLEVVAGSVPLATSFVAEKQTVFAEVSFSGEIVIHSSWCDLAPADKLFVLSHEIGHVVDRANKPWRFFAQLTYTAFLPWDERPTEQRANGYGRQILNY